MALRPVLTRVVSGWLAAAVLAIAACGKSDKPAARSDRPPAAVTKKASPLQREIDKALVLESALDKAKAALAEAERATPRDEALVAAKADAVKAMESTLARTRQTIEVLRARPEP